jgi:hypothetical protein
VTATRLLLLLAATVPLAAPPGAARAQDRPIAIKGATIETVGKLGCIEAGVIVLRDGKIEHVGPLGEVEIPEDARVRDASGMTLMPGVVEPAYPFQVPGGPSSPSGTRTIIIGGRVITLGGSSPTRSPTFTRVADSFDPFRADFDPLLRSGLTHLDLIPPDYGQAAVVRIIPDDPDAMLVEQDGRLYVSVSNSTASLDVVRKGLEATKRAASGGRERPSGQPDRGGSTPPGTTDRPGGDPSSRSSSPDSSRDLWGAVAGGKAPLLVDASNAAAILYLLDAIKEFKEARIALIASGADVYRTLDRLAYREGLTLLLRPTIDTMPDNRDRINLPRIAHEAGLEIAFTQGGNRFGLLSAQDTPLFDIGYLVATGLPRDVALEALTALPADLIGQGDSLGRLEQGKSASLLIFDGDPLDPYSRLRTVIIAGRTVYETD